MRNNLYFTICILLALMSETYAQQMHVNWSNSYANTTTLFYSNESRKMVRDVAGNTYVLADATSDLDPNGVLTGSIYHYTVLMHYDLTGNLITTRLINVVNHMTLGFDNPGAFGIEIGNDGFLYIGYNTYNSTTDFNVSIAKYSMPALVRSWGHTFNPLSVDQGVDLKVGSGGQAFAVVKSMTGTDAHYHIIKVVAGGTSTAPFYSFDQNIDFITTMIINNSNEIFVTGHRFISGVKNAMTAGVKATGILKWKRTYNGGTIIRDDSGKQLIMDADGYIYVCGSSDRGIPNLSDVMVMCYYSGNGKFIWVTFMDDSLSNDIGATLSQSDADNIYVGSVTDSKLNFARIQTATGTVTAQGSYSPLPSTPYNNIQSVNLNKMVVSSAQNIYCTGSIVADDVNNLTFSSSYVVKLIPVTYRTNIDDVIKLEFENIEGDLNESYAGIDLILDQSTSIIYLLRDKIIPFNTHSREAVEVIAYDIPAPNRIQSGTFINTNIVEAYPNPAVDYIEVKSAFPLNRIEVFDNVGRLVKNIDMHGDVNTKIHISNLPDAMYFLVIHSLSGEIQSKKFTKK